LLYVTPLGNESPILLLLVLRLGFLIIIDAGLEFYDNFDFLFEDEEIFTDSAPLSLSSF
jgi:hypothetical protein